MISRTTGLPSHIVDLSVNKTAGAEVTQVKTDSWRLKIPAGPQRNYRLAQLDDYTHLSRKQFRWIPPLSLELDARASDQHIQGTWGFGLWNDPFSFRMGFGGGTRRFPALPNAIWFFIAAPQNHLSLRDDLPTSGNLATVFSSPDMPSLLLAPGMILLPLIFFPPVARYFRRLARSVVRHESVSFITDLTRWHHYQLDWDINEVCFAVDGYTFFKSNLSPRVPLGLVMWIDNQFLAWSSNGRFNYGNLETSHPAGIEIKEFRLIQK